MQFELSAEDKRFLLKLARSAIEAKADGKAFDAPPLPDSPALSAKAGVFVSLHSGDGLRGCVGFINPETDVVNGVLRSARNAAFDDSRFPPVAAVELKGLEIEISLLLPPKPVGSYNEIELGKHGIILSKRGARALFLPQVAAEYGWDLPTTLTYLSKKAGLAPDAWKEGASFSVFESLVFSEKDFR